MEHYYNNPIVNGFCELIADSMFTTKSNKKTIESEKMSSQKKGKGEIIKTASSDKDKNKDFNYKSFKKLRNILFLSMFLKSNDLVRGFRYKRLRDETIPNQIAETFKEYLQRKIFDRLYERRGLASKSWPKLKSKSRRSPSNKSGLNKTNRDTDQGSSLTLINEEMNESENLNITSQI